jgi:hypothetical protein
VGVIGRFPAVVLVLTLSAGNAAGCAGWAASPAARMACCTEGALCPMHKSGTHESGSQRLVTQAQADQCCASSERQQSNSRASSSATTILPAVPGQAILLPAGEPARVLSDGWRTVAPVPIPSIPRHLLLSVFLV